MSSVDIERLQAFAEQATFDFEVMRAASVDWIANAEAWAAWYRRHPLRGRVLRARRYLTYLRYRYRL